MALKAWRLEGVASWAACCFEEEEEEEEEVAGRGSGGDVVTDSVLLGLSFF
jgi:hypothetical protein